MTVEKLSFLLTKSPQAGIKKNTKNRKNPLHRSQKYRWKTAQGWREVKAGGEVFFVAAGEEVCGGGVVGAKNFSPAYE